MPAPALRHPCRPPPVIPRNRALVLGEAVRLHARHEASKPAIVDNHVHLSMTRDKLLRDLKQRAWFGVSAAQSLGINGFDFDDLRGQAIPGAARYFNAGMGITRKEPGR